MSAQPLVFEGPDPEKLLIEAWAKHGTSVRISEPECIRTGGVYGFFSKLHYRIEVLPMASPEPVQLGAERVAAAPPRARRVTRPSGPRVTPSQVADDMAQAGSSTAARSPAESLEQLVEATTDVLEIRGPARRSFDEVLEGVAGSLGEDPEPIDADLLDRLDSRAPMQPTPGVASGYPAEIAAVDPPAVTSPAVPTPAGPGPAETTAGPAPASRGRLEEHPGTGGPDRRDRAGRAAAADEARALESIGVPREMIERAAATPGAWDLAEAVFAQLPVARPLPAVSGALVAIVGELGRALEIGGRIADELGLDDTDLAVASPSSPPCAFPPDLTVTDARGAVALSPGWRRDRVGIVAVDAASPGASSSWIRQILRSLRPSATLAVVSAVSKPEDIAHFTTTIGGVDALALDGMELTVTPASATALGIPIARLGDVAASPAAWSASVAHLLVPASTSVRAR